MGRLRPADPLHQRRLRRSQHIQHLKDVLTKVDKNTVITEIFSSTRDCTKLFWRHRRAALQRRLHAEENGHWRRVIVEKPFGHDLDSAKALNQQLLKVASECQIYRIDHYLGKETVQNILALRFANGIFEPIWNRRYIDHVQISVVETVGVEKRGGYYDNAGALRDMVPNHIMQLITLTAMEPPISFEANAVRDEQAKILHAIQPYSDEDVLSKTVRGQYGEGTIDGEHVPAYRSRRRSSTRFANGNVRRHAPADRQLALGGSSLLSPHRQAPRRPQYARRHSVPPRALRSLPRNAGRKHDAEPTRLHIQPEEGISLRFAAKTPGPAMQLGEVNMDFEYSDYFGQTPSTGYERLLHDCMIGDATLFQRADMVEAGWSIVNPVLDVWKALPPSNFPNYASGSWGPKESDELIERDGRRWRNFEK